MTNEEKLREIFPKTIFIYRKKDDKTTAIMCSDEWLNAEYKEPTTKNNLAQERYQDLIEYFGDEKVAKTILKSRKEFKAWLERLRWNVKRADELARELEQLKGTTKNDLPHNLCDSCTNIGCELQSGIVRTKCAFYMPSITPQEPKTGHWIRVDKDKLRCSKCDVIHFIAQYPQGKIVWCPNCGAKMESEDK